jgi:hypothetical protein
LIATHPPSTIPLHLHRKTASTHQQCQTEEEDSILPCQHQAEHQNPPQTEIRMGTVDQPVPYLLTSLLPKLLSLPPLFPLNQMMMKWNPRRKKSRNPLRRKWTIPTRALSVLNQLHSGARAYVGTRLASKSNNSGGLWIQLTFSVCAIRLRVFYKYVSLQTLVDNG